MFVFIAVQTAEPILMAVSGTIFIVLVVSVISGIHQKEEETR